jgi:hypothetical protein
MTSFMVQFLHQFKQNGVTLGPGHQNLDPKPLVFTLQTQYPCNTSCNLWPGIFFRFVK